MHGQENVAGKNDYVLGAILSHATVLYGSIYTVQRMVVICNTVVVISDEL